MLINKDVAMTTRYGVTLRADLYRPDGPGRFPVLLSRLPYDSSLRRRPGECDVTDKRSPLAPSPRDPGWRNAVFRVGASLTRGSARFGAKASVGTAIDL